MRINKWLKTMTIALGLSLAALPAYAEVDLSGVNGRETGNLSGIVNLSGAGNIINWDKFNIGSGSVLNFVNSADKWAVLNRVTGGSFSQLDGAIKASAGGTVFLVNPAGIVFGNGFTTNANTFVASTLKLSDEAFNNYVNGAGTLAFADDNSGSIKVNGMKADGYVTLVGNSINVAPGVTMEAKDLSLVAGNNVTFNIPHDNSLGFTELAQYNSSTGNTVTIGDETGGIVTINTDFDFNALGSKVDIKNVKIENAQKIDVLAANEIEDMENTIYTKTVYATKDNVINIKSLDAGMKAFYIEGGKISVDDLTYNILPDVSCEIIIEAANKFECYDEQPASDDNMFADEENNVRLSNVTINNSNDAPGLIVVAGGSVDIDSLNANAEKGEIIILAGKEYLDSEVKNADTSNTISIKNLEADAGAFYIEGGKISVDGLIYNMLPSDSSEITIEAANKFERNNEQSGSDDKMFAAKENNVKLSNVTINNSNDAPGLIVVAGGAVDIDSLNANAEKGEIGILAGKEYSEGEVMNADTSNTISIKNSKLQTDTDGNNLPHVTVLGGNINLENTTIDTYEAYLGAGENVSVVREDGDYWFNYKGSLTTKAGNNIAIDSKSRINAEVEAALVANAVNNQGTLSANGGVNIYAVDGWKYDMANDTLDLSTSPNNVITNRGSIVDNSTDWGSTFFADSLVNIGNIQSEKEQKYLTAEAAENSNCIRISHVSNDDEWQIDFINSTVDKPSEDSPINKPSEGISSKSDLVDEAVKIINSNDSNLTPEEQEALTKTIEEETPVKITESSQQAANDTKQLDIPASQKLGAVEPTPMTEESAPAVSVEE